MARLLPRPWGMGRNVLGIKSVYAARCGQPLRVRLALPGRFRAEWALGAAPSSVERR